MLDSECWCFVHLRIETDFFFEIQDERSGHIANWKRLAIAKHC